MKDFYFFCTLRGVKLLSSSCIRAAYPPKRKSKRSPISVGLQSATCCGCTRVEEMQANEVESVAAYHERIGATLCLKSNQEYRNE